MVGKTTKGINSLLLAVLFSLTGYAYDVDSNTGKSGYLTETFFLFQVNSNKQLLQWDSDLGQVTSRKSSSYLPFTLRFSGQQPEQLGAAIVPLATSLSPGPSWYSFPTASMATFPLPQGTPPQSSPQKNVDSKTLAARLLGGALIGVGVYLMATSEKEFVRERLCICKPCTSEDTPGCSLVHDQKMGYGALSVGMGAFIMLATVF
jgi:hypothetical protein